MGRCLICGAQGKTISDRLGACVDCIRKRPRAALEVVSRLRSFSRRRFNLPPRPPAGPTPCGMCGVGCSLGVGDVGYCGLVKNVGGGLRGLGSGLWRACCLTTTTQFLLTASQIGCVPPLLGGVSKIRQVSEGEFGYYNLAVFYGACSLDCLYCQNWTYRRYPSKPELVSVEELDRAMERRVTCICFFGGDPAPQVAHALMVARRAVERGLEYVGRLLDSWHPIC